MRRPGLRSIAIAVGLAVWSGGWPSLAKGDGGTLRDWQRQESYEIAVFTDPTPLVAGPVDISVLLLDAATGEPVSGATVTVEVTPKDRAGRGTRHLATPDAATNKLFYAALFELPAAGRYMVNVLVERPVGRAQLQFDLDVASRSTPRAGIWLWILWPAPVIALYGTHRLLVARRERPQASIQ